ncbi:MAG: helix-turn-helix domain-containing protein [Fimbriimonadaceae bacterium]|nr:helix-turn-helix domain-containing protein [Fimbriimonadaceae bacterium]
MKLFTIKEVCSGLAISRSKLYELIRANEIRTIRIGKRGVRISESEVARFIAEGELRSGEWRDAL